MTYSHRARPRLYPRTYLGGELTGTYRGRLSTLPGNSSYDRLNVVKLVLFSGLPGTGKSTLATGLGKKLSMPVFSFDWIAGCLSLQGVVTKENRASVIYSLLRTLAARQFELGQSAIIDSPTSSLRVRNDWYRLADEHSVGLYPIYCICSNEELHRSRIASRRRNIPGWPDPDWPKVEIKKREFAPWPPGTFKVDSVASVDLNLNRLLRHLAALVQDAPE